METYLNKVVLHLKIEMSSTTETRNSMPVFITIGFSGEEIKKKGSQRVEKYLQDAIANETAYKDSLMHVSGILSYK